MMTNQMYFFTAVLRMCIYDVTSYDNKLLSSSFLINKRLIDRHRWWLTFYCTHISPLEHNLGTDSPKDQVPPNRMRGTSPFLRWSPSPAASCFLWSSFLSPTDKNNYFTIHTYKKCRFESGEPCGTPWWQPPARVWQTAGACGRVCSGSVVSSSRDRPGRNWERSSPPAALGFLQRWKVWTQTCCIKNSS